MLETLLKLLERFVVAHELIAANSAKQTIVEAVGNVVRAEEKVVNKKQGLGYINVGSVEQILKLSLIV